MKHKVVSWMPPLNNQNLLKKEVITSGCTFVCDELWMLLMRTRMFGYYFAITFINFDAI